jgi:hypothetical protein
MGADEIIWTQVEGSNVKWKKDRISLMKSIIICVFHQILLD